MNGLQVRGCSLGGHRSVIERGHSRQIILDYSSISKTTTPLPKIMALVRFNAAKSSQGRDLITHAGYEYGFEVPIKILEMECFKI